MLREDPPATRYCDLMTSAADALQTRRDRARRGHLNDQIYSPHIDAEFKRTRGHKTLELTAFQLVFYDESALARQRPVMRLDEFFTLPVRRKSFGLVTPLFCGKFIEPTRQPLGHSARIHKQQSGMVLFDQLEQLGIH